MVEIQIVDDQEVAVTEHRDVDLGATDSLAQTLLDGGK
jgi:hypothetical protein